MVNHHSAARAYAAKKIPILPLYEPTPQGCSCRQPGCDDAGKHPRTGHGVHDASASPATIDRWWGMWPNAGIGIAVGLAGWLVIDVDALGIPAWRRLASGLLLPETLTAYTGGGGLHVVYRMPPGGLGNSSGELPPGIHVRGQGGYIVAAPSVHASGDRYRWAERRTIAAFPLSLLRILRPPKQQREKPPSPHPEGGPRIYVDGRHLGPGERNRELYRVAAAWRGRFGMGVEDITTHLLEANEARCRPPLSEAEVERIARSAGRYADGPA